MTHVDLNPQLIRWARERAGLKVQDLRKAFPKLDRWERGEESPTLKQVEGLAKAVHVPIGYLFLPDPPVESVPIPDFRTVGNVHVGHPSPDLLDTVYICQQRQEWYRDYARSMREDPYSFAGSVRLGSDVEATAALIRKSLVFDLEERRQMSTWTDALRRFIAQADELGVLVMCSGVVFNNNKRRLNPDEFRGFAMADEFAPLVFINGSDSKAAQMFTLAHELAHIWIGQSGVSDSQAGLIPEDTVERWCNQIAAELLVPLQVLRAEYQRNAGLQEMVARFARRFKVSNLVILRRIHDAGFLTRGQFNDAYAKELARLRAIPTGSGGNFYLTQAARVSKRFARAIVVSTLEGQTLYRDAFRMLGFSKHTTFQELGRSLGVVS